MRKGRAPTAEQITTQDMLRRISERELSEFPPFTLDASVAGADESRPVGTLRVVGHGLDVKFSFVCHAKWDLRRVQQQLEHVRRGGQPDALPMVILPHLTREHLEDLQREGLSGLDFSGNGLLFAPPRLFVLRMGEKPRFKPVPATASIYHSHHISSLVARVFLCQPHFVTVRDVLAACHARMMPLETLPPALSLPTVSKALARLEADLLIIRKGSSSQLRQPERLLTQLDRSFEMPVHADPFLGKTAFAEEVVWSRLNELRPKLRVVATGIGSARKYTGLAGPERLRLYVSDAGLTRSALAAKPTRAFPNLEIIETTEEVPYFDAQEDAGVFWASPIQTYLELLRGDARERDVAQELRRKILRDSQPK